MKLRINKSYFYPLTVFLVLWAGFLSLRMLPVIEWGSLSSITIFYLISFLLVVTCVYVVSLLYFDKEMGVRVASFKLIKVKIIYYLFAVLSLIGVLFSVLDYYIAASNYSKGLSVSGLTELRYTIASEGSQELSSIGVVGTFFSGFSLTFFLIAYFFKDALGKKKFLFATVVFLLYAMTTLLSGGRNGFLTALLIVYIARFYLNIFESGGTNATLENKGRSKLFKYLLILLVLFFLYYSGMVFIEREGFRGRDFYEAFSNLEFAFGFKFNQFLVGLSGNDFFGPLVFVFMFFFYYLFHSINQLDVVLNMPEGNYFPYLGALNFYMFFLVFDKLGFDVLTIGTVLNDMERSGTYMTLLGPLYLDFGILGALIFITFMVSLFTYNLVQFRRRKNIVSFINLVFLSCVFMLSPIFSFFALATAASFMVSVVALNVFFKFKLGS